MSKDKENTKKKRNNISENPAMSHRGSKTIRIFFETSYGELVDDIENYRSYLLKYYKLYPEAFPCGSELGFHWHDKRVIKKQKGLIIRRIKLTDGSVYEIVPSSLMPYMSGLTQEVSKGLFLRQWGVPYEAIAYLFGRNAMYWERCEESLGRLSIVGSLVKRHLVPTHLAADEKISYWNGGEVYIGLTSSADCVLGAELSMNRVAEPFDTENLQEAYGVFKSEALDCQADYSPKSVNLDGWRATNQSWKNLFPTITIIVCFLHAFLKVREVAKSLKEKFYEIGDKIWEVYRKENAIEFRQEIVTLLIWIQSNCTKNERVKNKVQDLCSKVEKFVGAYEHPQCYGTSNQIDRPMNMLDRYLYQMRYFKGHRKTANLKIRAWAMLYNFTPFSQRVQKQKNKLKKSSRFEEFNEFVYHNNWLENMLVAGSMNGFKQSHTIR